MAKMENREMEEKSGLFYQKTILNFGTIILILYSQYSYIIYPPPPEIYLLNFTIDMLIWRTI